MVLKLATLLFLTSSNLITEWHQQKTTGKKSLPLAYIEKNGIEIIPGIAPRIPYLKAVDQFLSMKEND